MLDRRPIAAFYDDNAKGIIPSLQASTLLAHVRAASYNAVTVIADENCHPFSFKQTPWIIAQNGALPHWKVLQRELLPLCKNQYLEQMRGTTDTEFLYVLLLSLMENDSDEGVQSAFEQMLKVIVQAMKKHDLVALTKLKIALVRPDRIIGINYGLGHDGETHPVGDWKALRKSGSGTDDYALSMLLEPMYLLTGRNFQDYENSYKVDVCPDDQATSAIFASEPLTEEADDWLNIEFGEIVFLEKKDERVSRKVRKLNR